MYLNSDNGLLLAKKFEEIPNVTQVRFNHPLRRDVIDLIGEDGLHYCCYVESLNQDQAEQNGSKIYQRVVVYLKKEVYDNVDNHGHLQAMMNERIGSYYKTGIVVDEVPAFEYPFSVDADGNKIAYELTRSNPLR